MPEPSGLILGKQMLTQTSGKCSGKVAVSSITLTVFLYARGHSVLFSLIHPSVHFVNKNPQEPLEKNHFEG